MKATNMLKVEFSPAEIAQALAEHMKSKVPTVAGLASHTFNITVQVNPDGQVVGTSLESATLIFDLEETETDHILSSEANGRRLKESIGELAEEPVPSSLVNEEEDEEEFQRQIIESRRLEALND